MSNYSKQHRGERDAYESYFKGMDASMQQKVALTTAYFPTRGRIADMGSGSGRGTFDLARLYSELELVGVDINPVSVVRSNETFQRPNLSYEVGDIAEQVFPENSLDGILNSSVLHHVTSFNQFDVRRVFDTFDNQVAQLKSRGVIIIRDFVIPEGPQRVWLELPNQDGAEDGAVEGLSTAALFERFARDWRSSVNSATTVPFVRLASSQSGWNRYEVALRAATEFILRKDYRADWDAELLEEYTYLSQAEFEAAFRARGLRIVCSMPLWNPWIVQNRFVGRFLLFDLNGLRLHFPPTNYLIAGEKVAAEVGVELVESQPAPLALPQFLQLKSYLHQPSQRQFELVERAFQTMDLLPWFESNGQLFILAKKDFPRPIINACADHPNLNRATRSGYITEPISAIVKSDETPMAVVERLLHERAGIGSDAIREIGDPLAYFTSPGGLNEQVVARLVEIEPCPSLAMTTPNYTRFTDAGTVRELDAGQTLRACHVGGMFDARLEINLYRLFRTLARPVGPWIGAPITLTQHQDSVSCSETQAVLSPLANEVFTLVENPATPQFLSLTQGLFIERNAAGETLASVPFEYVAPREFSKHTATAIPVLKTEQGVFIGLEHRDLPAAQTFTHSARLAVVPAWRIPFAVTHIAELPPFLTQMMRREFSLAIRQIWELGGAYFPTPGVTPEIVYPFAIEVEAQELSNSDLQWASLSDVIAHLDLLKDAHSLIVICRLAHALGLMDF